MMGSLPALESLSSGLERKFRGQNHLELPGIGEPRQLFELFDIGRDDEEGGRDASPFRQLGVWGLLQCHEPSTLDEDVV